MNMVTQLEEETQNTNNMIVKMIENYMSDFNLEFTDTEIIIDKYESDLKVLSSYYKL